MLFKFLSYINTYPSSLYTKIIAPVVDLYFIVPGIGCGPWILLFATSNGIFTHEPRTPDVKPMATLRPNSNKGSCNKIMKLVSIVH